MLNSLRTKNINCEQEAKFIQDRIVFTEKHFAEFCHTFSEYTRKAARVRDKGDDIARVSNHYAESEHINKSLCNGLANFSNCMTTISDYGDMRVKNIDNKVVHELSQYETICKNVKEEVKQIFSARDKEMLRKRQLDRIRERNPRNRQQIMQAETEVVKATADVARTVHNLEEQVTSFERQKLHDIKAIFLDFISNEMGYHAKALELLTVAYQDINNVDEEVDLQAFQKVRGKMESEFKKALRMPEAAGQTVTKRNIFKTSQSLGSITTLFSTPQRRRAAANSNMRKSKEQLSKSEETLDSMKRSISDSEATESDDDEDENNSQNSTENDSKISPFIARKYQK